MKIKDQLGYDFQPASIDEISREAAERQEDIIIEFQGEQILRDQYQALEDIARQYGKKPDELFHESNLLVENHYVKILMPDGEKIQTPDKRLTISDTLTRLEQLTCTSSQLMRLEIPETLTRLKIIECYGNQLKELNIPDTLTKLTHLFCAHNQLTELYIPPTLTELTHIICSQNQIPENTLQELRQRGIKIE